ncbi:MAG: acetyl-CoA decarbonylase/synthase complex subunit delta [Lachnospiraceae bacterium]|nr:acetyl-CoA decarbonylase/synthase complex subunit delta [Lachnospiraceae bacterium]
MPFVPKVSAYNAKINTLVIGTGEKALKLGGNNTLPFYEFDAVSENKPAIGVEISDLALEEYVQPGLKSFYEGCDTIPAMAKKAQEIPGASFIALTLASADPNGANTSVEDCVALVKEVADAIELPLAVAGCKNIEKDAELFNKISEALTGKNILVLSAREENYKTIGASAGLAYGQKVGAESAVDINLAKQLNTIMLQLGVSADAIAIQAGSAAAGYGYEYVASTLDRIKNAALQAADSQLQMPIVTPVSAETWAVKESTLPQEEQPEWGDPEQRGIEMEITTASACLACGSDAVILRHPESIKTIAGMIDALTEVK